MSPRMTMALSLIATASTVLVPLTNAVAQEPLRIGIVLPLSGPNAQFGQNSRNGIELALDLLKEREPDGLAQSVELVFADVPAPGAAASAVQRMVAQDGVVGVVGSFVSSITLAASEVTERAEVPMITHSFADQWTCLAFMESVFRFTRPASRIEAG